MVGDIERNQQIVHGYIRLKDWKTLEALREDWRQMRSRLQESSMGGFEVSPSIQQSTERFLRSSRVCERWIVLLGTFRYPENHTDSARGKGNH